MKIEKRKPERKPEESQKPSEESVLSEVSHGDHWCQLMLID